MKIRQLWSFISTRKPAFFGYVYVLLIPGFAVLFWLLQGFKQGHISFLEALYFSAVTITTLGYGDIQPVEIELRLFAAAEAVLGVVTIGFFLSSLSQKRADEMAEEQLAWMSGGDSIPCLNMTSGGFSLSRLRGKYPIFDLHVEFQEFWWPLPGEALPEKFWEVVPSPPAFPMKTPPYRNISVLEVPVQLPNLNKWYPDHFRFVPEEMMFPETGKFYLSASFRSRNGSFRQFIAGKKKPDENGKPVWHYEFLLLDENDERLQGDDKWVKKEPFVASGTDYHSDGYIREW